MRMTTRALFLTLLAVLAVSGFVPRAAAAGPDRKERHYLYVVEPGIRNYLEFGGAGILVFDMDNGHKFVKRIATPPPALRKSPRISRASAPAPRPKSSTSPRLPSSIASTW